MTDTTDTTATPDPRRRTDRFGWNGCEYEVRASFVGDLAYGSHVVDAYTGDTITDVAAANGNVRVLDAPVTDEEAAAILDTEAAMRAKSFATQMRAKADREADEYRREWEAAEGRPHWSDPILDARDTGF